MASKGVEMNVVAIVQARLRSTRLPGKVLSPIGGAEMLRLVLERTAAARGVNMVVAAIPEGDEEDALAKAIDGWGFKVVRGDATDVLSRYAAAAETFGADVVVRVTGDCPLIDPRLVDAVVEELVAHPHLDYVALGLSFPDGENAEAFTRSALERAVAEATRPSHREHVTLFIRDHPELFRLRILEHSRDLSAVRLSVDEKRDLDLVDKIVAELGSSADVGFEAYAAAYEELATFEDRLVTRDEGLWHSLNEDALDQIGLIHGREQSERWLERARAVIPCATQTLSKAVDQFVAGVSPVFLASGRGAHVTDVDGNTFIDYPMALGPVILGYAYPRTIEAVAKEVTRGSIFTLPHPLEVEVAERVVDLVPSAEMVRFAKNGSDATTAAVRLARAVTGRDVIVTCGYHGWHDWYVVQTGRNAGVPAELARFVRSVPFNDLSALEQALEESVDQIAGAIVEVGIDEPAPGFLAGFAERVRRAGGVVIFDEIITGFRYAKGGAQERYGVTPDLTCLGKAMANGLPLSAVAGRRSVMEVFERVFFSATFGGETLSLAAARATLDEIAAGDVIDHIWSTGAALREGMSRVIEDSGLDVVLQGVAARSGLAFRRDGEDWPALKGLFLQEAVRRGVLFGGPIFISYSHRPCDIDRTLVVFAETFDVLRTAVQNEAVDELLDGPAPTTVFRPA